jgi:hypothetical protein
MSLFKQLFRNMAMGGHSSGGSGGHHGRNYGASPSNGAYTYAGQATPMKICQKCNSTQANQAQFCSQCGTSLAPPSCHNCGTLLAANSKFCNQCGQTITT